MIFAGVSVQTQASSLLGCAARERGLLLEVSLHCVDKELRLELVVTVRPVMPDLGQGDCEQEGR